MNKAFTSFCSSLLVFTLLLGVLFSCGSKEIINLDSIPEFSDSAYVEINGNVPFFEDDEITEVSFEEYSPLDPLGRCGVAFACIGIDIMPTEEREEIGSVTPSGWEHNGASNNREYDFVDGSYIYNRCHLIGFQLAGENANEKNLITGTRYLNIEGMLPFENMVADYVKETKNHVMYRATPIYNGLDLVASGVLLEGYSVEDDGHGICFCVYAYNVQPGVKINYFTGQNTLIGGRFEDAGSEDNSGEESTTYILNTSSKKFHYPDKSCSDSIKSENRDEYSGSREELINDGYTPCGICKP